MEGELESKKAPIKEVELSPEETAALIAVKLSYYLFVYRP